MVNLCTSVSHNYKTKLKNWIEIEIMSVRCNYFIVQT